MLSDIVTSGLAGVDQGVPQQDSDGGRNAGCRAFGRLFLDAHLLEVAVPRLVGQAAEGGALAGLGLARGARSGQVHRRASLHVHCNVKPAADNA